MKGIRGVGWVWMVVLVGWLPTPSRSAEPVHAFHAFIRTASYAAEGNRVRVPFSGERYDVSDDYDPAAAAFTVPRSGIYHFTVNLNIAYGKDRTFEPGLRVVRVGKPVSHSITQSAGSGTVSWSVDLLLYAGDLVFVTVDKQGDAPLRISGGDGSWFTGRLVTVVDVEE